MILDDEQQKVINEFLKEATEKRKRKEEGKSGLHFVNMEDHFARLDYLRNYGKDSPRFLIIEYIEHLKQAGHPEDQETIELLTSVVPKSSLSEWLTETQYMMKYGTPDNNKISYDGYGYYKIGSIRVDADDYAHNFEVERKRFNSWKGNDNNFNLI